MIAKAVENPAVYIPNRRFQTADCRSPWIRQVCWCRGEGRLRHTAGGRPLRQAQRELRPVPASQKTQNV